MSLGRCGVCKREWGGSAECHCGGPTGCHEQFNSVTAFDRHRKDFACIPVVDFGKPHGKAGRPLLVRSARGVWVTELREGATALESTPSGRSGQSEGAP